MLVLAGLAYSLSLVIHLVSRSRLSIVDVSYFYLSMQFVAVLNNGHQDHSNYFPAAIFALGILSMTVGLAMAGNKALTGISKRRTHSYATTHSPKEISIQGFLMMFLFVVIVVIYNYSAGGIPLFSEDVLVERFEGSRAGLFGVPGRIATSGASILLFILSVLVTKTQVRYKRIIFMSVIIVDACALVLNGNKGALLVVIQVLLICFSYSQAKLTNLVKVSDIAIVASLAVGIALVIGTVQLTASRGSEGVLEHLEQRILFVSGMPFYYLVTQFMSHDNYSWGHYMATDFAYVFLRAISPDAATANLSQEVSAAIHDREIGSAFIVPTTLTIFGEYYASFGITGVALLSTLFGWCYRIVINSTYYAKGIVSASILMFVQLVFFTSSTQGNSTFAFANGAFALVSTYMLYYFARTITGPRHYSRPVNGLLVEQKVASKKQ